MCKSENKLHQDRQIRKQKRDKGTEKGETCKDMGPLLGSPPAEDRMHLD